jgi:ACT domain-containing protein
VLETIAGEGGNVVEVDHHREGFGLPFGTVEISIAFEAGGPEHTDRIRQALAEFLA